MDERRVRPQWRGAALLRPGLLVLRGAIGAADLHAHHTVQVLVAREGDVVLGDRFGAESACRAAIIPPNVPHRVVRGVADGLLVLFDAQVAVAVELGGMPRPADRAGGWSRAASELGIDDGFRWLWGEYRIAPDSAASNGASRGAAIPDRPIPRPTERAIGDGWAATATRPCVQVQAWVRDALRHGSGTEWLRGEVPMQPWPEPEAESRSVGNGGAVEVARHPAVAEILRILPTRLDAGPIRLADLARTVHLSESRLAHVFSDEIGLPLRPYVRWLRIQRAVELIATGRSLTAAAHGAGFADSAHLTRTCRAMFGAPPSDFGAIRWVRDVREFPR
ncbi:helix-turn-helix transcriptional regulator [Nocardia amamiensis]|uniref:helix-turn-helix transcriptional regulator n=1 Tax=Nocardia amamiensis TaxID=404578 RepID=UPI00082D475D|nr:helix-turn-helix transcriptional regulator [Nocardia amamiensis]